MSKWNTWETDTLELIFQNVDPGYAIGGSSGIRGSAVAGNLYVALFAGDPAEDESGVAGNECSYTGYNRVAVARSAAGWTVSGDTVINAAAITFGTDTSGSETATYFGICKAPVKTVSDLIFYGLLSGGGLAISVGVTPQIQAGDLTVTEY